jgi:hypothetical protein
MSGWLAVRADSRRKAIERAAHPPGDRMGSLGPITWDRYPVHGGSRRAGLRPIGDVAPGETAGSVSAFLVSGMIPPSTA